MPTSSAKEISENCGLVTGERSEDLLESWWDGSAAKVELLRVLTGSAGFLVPH